MDPDENLAEQRRRAERLLDGTDAIDPADALRLAELVLALDEWLSRGGQIPKRWCVVDDEH